MVFLHTGASILGGIITVAVTYLVYRKSSVSVWAWIASFFPDMPVFWLATLGATNLGGVLLVSHTMGIFLFPLLLVIVDILLLEIVWIRYISWLPYPKYMRTIRRIDAFMEKLESYHAIPRPIRVKRVYAVGVLAGVIHLVINVLFIGSL